MNSIFKIFWDLETTGRTRSRIVSIGYASDDDAFEGELLVRPKIHIDSGAFLVHGYTHDDLRDQPTARTQLLEFMRRIASLEHDVIMIAHNGKSFDSHVLRHELETENVALAPNIVGFVDSLHWIRHTLKTKQASIDILLQRLFHETARSIHGAQEDCRILKRIFHHVLERASDKSLKYFESTAEFLQRTQKWTDPDEHIKDAMEEMIFTLETQCEHDFAKAQHLDIDKRRAFQHCTKCSSWRLVEEKIIT